MAVKSVDMVRKIRNKQYEATKGVSVEGQVKFIKAKSKDLQKRLKRGQQSTANNTMHV